MNEALERLDSALVAVANAGPDANESLDEAMRACGLPRHEMRPAGGVFVHPNARTIFAPSTLDATQRAAATRWLRESIVPPAYPMPSSHGGLRRWLGLDPPGVLFTETSDGVPFLRYRAMDVSARAAWLDSLPIDQRIEAAFELVLLALDIPSANPAQPALFAAALEVGREQRAWALAAAERLLSMPKVPDPGLSRIVYAALAASGDVDERFEAWLPIDAWTDVAALTRWAEAIAPERREAAMVRVLETHRGGAACKAAARMLAPFPSAGLARVVVRWLSEASKPNEVLAVMKTVAQTAPEVRAVLEEHERANAAMNGLRVTKMLTPPAITDLDDTRRAQLEHAAKLYDGTRESAAQILAGLPGERMIPSTIAWHEVSNAKGEPLFDVWTYMVDTGCMFASGTLDVAGEQVQGGWEIANAALRLAIVSALAKSKGATAKTPAARKTPSAGKTPAARKSTPAKKAPAAKKKPKQR